MGTIARQTDMTSGACGSWPIPALQASAVNTLIEGLKPVMVGDFWNKHKRGKHWHDEFALNPLPTNVYIEGSPVFFTGNVLSNGDVIATGALFTKVG